MHSNSGLSEMNGIRRLELQRERIANAAAHVSSPEKVLAAQAFHAERVEARKRQNG